MVARRYGQRPSALAGLHPEDPVALAFDYAVAVRGVIHEGGSPDRPDQVGPGAMLADNLPDDAFIRF